MEELYGLHSTAGFSDHHHQNMADPDHHHHLGSGMSPATTYPFSFPAASNMDHLFSASSAVSDAVSVQRGSEEEISSAIRAKIVSHPLYPNLIQAYIDCQKVGAPPEIACVLDELRRETDASKRTAVVSSCLGADPELDDFMEAYCDVLVRHRSDLSKTFEEATSFLSNIEAQLSNLCCNNNTNASRSYVSDEGGGSSEDEMTEEQEGPRRDEDRDLKDKLLRKYSGYISTLKHEFSKKKKKGKLPREAKQILLDWWNSHYKWPYPTEVDKVLLAESTGLDQKQISNWFINQRKRHWKPSENMQFAAMDSLYGPYFSAD